MRIAVYTSVDGREEPTKVWEAAARRIARVRCLRATADVVLVIDPTRMALITTQFYAPQAKIIAIFLEEPSEGVEWAYEAGADLTTVHRADPDEAEKVLRELLDIPA